DALCQGGRDAEFPGMALTPFGEAMLPLLAQVDDREEGDEEDGEEEEPPAEFGLLRPLFQPYFPQWQKNLSFGMAHEAGDGVFVFKVSLGKDVWRRIAMNDEHTVDDLVAAILRSVDFDFDHLYELKYRDEVGRTISVTHPMADDGYSGADVCLGELPIQPGD